jgi:hypothetical protein
VAAFTDSTFGVEKYDQVHIFVPRSYLACFLIHPVQWVPKVEVGSCFEKHTTQHLEVKNYPFPINEASTSLVMMAESTK